MINFFRKPGCALNSKIPTQISNDDIDAIVARISLNSPIKSLNQR